MKMWQRYFYKQYIGSILFVLFSFYALYIIVDAMSHLDQVIAYPSLSTWTSYYLANFFKRLDILLPFALLVATIRTLYSFNIRGELVALLTCGISKQKLFTPLLVTACFFSGFLFINYEWILPGAVATVDHFETTKWHKSRSDSAATPKEIMLKDGSKLVFSEYNREKNQFSDLFWILSSNKLYYIKRLDLSHPIPVGYFVEYIARSPNGMLEKIASYESFEFKKLAFDPTLLKEALLPPSASPLSKLVKQFSLYFNSSSTKSAEIKANLFHKGFFPLLCLLAAIAPAPFCFSCRRSIPILLIYLLALAALFLLNLILHTAFVMAKFQALSAYTAILIPWLCITTFMVKNYRKLATD